MNKEMSNLEQQISKFEEQTGRQLNIKNNKPYYAGDLDLDGCTGITSLPDNLTVGGYLDLEGCTGITSLPDNLIVGGSLYLRDTGITSLPDNLTVGGYLDLRDTGITSLPDNLTVGGYLDLRDTGITSLPDNLIVGGYLDLDGTGITSLPDNLTVGEYLDLRGTGITSLPDNLTVGGGLYLCGTGIKDTSKVKNKLSQDARQRIKNITNQVLRWEFGNRIYIKVDGIFSQLISQRGNVSVIRQIGKDRKEYLVTDGLGRWAHGDTIADAREDLIYKISNRDKSAYENLTLDSELTFEECIECYRVITGACAAGTRDYVENRLPKPHKEKYTIREIIDLTDGEYGSNALKEFFTK